MAACPPSTRRKRPLSPVAQAKLALDELVAEGLLETRLRPDGQVGYYVVGAAR